MIDASIIEVLGKTVGLLGSVFTLYKFLSNAILNRRPRLRKEYQFVKEFLHDVASVSPAHPFMIEKGFAAVSGKEDLTASEIIYFLSQPSPSLSLRRYTSARRRYVVFSDRLQRVIFRQPYGSARSRRRSKVLNAIGYFVFACLALIPLFFSSELFGKNWQLALVFIAMFFGAFGPQAILCGLEVGRLGKAEKLVSEQRDRTTKTVELNLVSGDADMEVLKTS